MVTKVTQPFKVAAVEFNPEMFEFDRNLERACEVIEEAASNGAKLIVLPEAALSGYIYKDRDQFLPFMDSVPGKSTDAIAELTSKHHCYVALGVAELDPATNLTYNTGVLVGPDGYIGKYRKNGLNPSDILWFVPGNTGYPVFETELGNICMVICYDDTYWEPARVPAVKGADIIAYICSSDRVLTELSESSGNHSTIAAVQQLCAWNGLAMVAADRNNAESNPTTGVSVTYGGSASIWQADGRRTGHAPATNANMTSANPGTILYGEIDPALYDNDQKATLKRRRPELYGELAFYKAPTDNAATTVSQEVSLTAVQYQIQSGAVDENLKTVEQLVEQIVAADTEPGLLVFPAFTLCGVPQNQDEAAHRAEGAIGRTVQTLSDFAVRTRKHVVGSYIEKDQDQLFHTVALVAPDGTVIGQYRQTHLDPAFEIWATPGDALEVFETAIGRIGLLTCEDLRFPEASGVLSVKRADLIAVPTSWDGSYGGPLHDAGGLFAHQYPENTMCQWYAAAKTSQAYTVVANAVGNGAQGSSGVFSINPIDSDEGPEVASTDSLEFVTRKVHTLGQPGWWMNQSRLIGGRRADLAVPLTLDPTSEAFTKWQQSPGFDQSGWTAY